MNAKLTFPTGIEIETSAIGFQVPRLPDTWAQKRDASCGSEFVSGKIEYSDHLFSEIEEACRAISLSGGRINDRCGLHVHAGFKQIKDLSAKYRVFRMLRKYEKLILSLAKPLPTRKRFCLPVTPSIWEAAMNGRGFNGFKSTTSRYFWVNGKAMEAHGTIEFRCHNGSLDPDEICGWVSLIQCIFNAAVTEYVKVDWNPTGRETVKSLVEDARVMENPAFGQKALAWLKSARG